MDNSMATKPYSTLKGDPWRAYDALPAEIRLALQEALVDWCPLRAREWHDQLLRERRLRPAQAMHIMIQTIRRHDQDEVAAFAKTWPAGAKAYPHVAAGASLQRYAGTAGIPAGEPIVIPPMPKRSETPAKPSRAPAKRAKAPTGRSKAPAKRKAARRGRR
jgi:hypothetical protein